MKVASGSCVARYYDPRTSVWQSVDPILGEYLDGKRGMGGVYNSPNLGLYTYTHLNPVKFVDPDGNEVGIIKLNVKASVALRMVKSTATGKNLWSSIKNNKAVINIRSNNGAALGSSNTQHFKKNGDNEGFTALTKKDIKNGIQADRIDIAIGTGSTKRRLLGIKNSKKTEFVPSVARIMAHELGHTTGELDDGGSGLSDFLSSPNEVKTSNMNNVNKWETPIMNELGSDIQRSAYTGANLGKETFKPATPGVLKEE